MLEKKHVSFIGGGAIAEALISGLVKGSHVEPSQITVNDVVVNRLAYLENLYGIKSSTDGKEVAAKADILFLTVKPQVISNILELLAPVISDTTIVISVAAGVTIADLQDKLPGVPVVRVMPNTPVAVSEGMSAIALGKYATKQIEEIVSYIFKSVGRVVTVDESSMDAVTGLSGSGPAYAFLLIDALSDAGVYAGLSRQTAVLLAAQTLLGAAKMVLETGEHPARLRDMVTSPGGTTITGIRKLEQHAVRAAMMDAVISAAEKSREMGTKK